MTGNELQEWCEFHSLSRSVASVLLEVDRSTLWRQIQNGDNDITGDMALKALMYSRDKAMEDQNGVDLRLNDIFNQVYYLTRIKE